MNVGGPEYLRRRAGQELTPLDRHTRRVLERREEAWRPLNKYRVAAFIRMLVLYIVESENGHPRGPHPEIVKTLHKALITDHPVYLSADNGDHGRTFLDH